MHLPSRVASSSCISFGFRRGVEGLPNMFLTKPFLYCGSVEKSNALSVASRRIAASSFGHRLHVVANPSSPWFRGTILTRFSLNLHDLQQRASKEYGGSVWESNPPFGSRRAGSMALKATKITGPLSPPSRIIAAGLEIAYESEGSERSGGLFLGLMAATFLRASSRSFGSVQTS